MKRMDLDGECIASIQRGNVNKGKEWCKKWRWWFREGVCACMAWAGRDRCYINVNNGDVIIGGGGWSGKWKEVGLYHRKGRV